MLRKLSSSPRPHDIARTMSDDDCIIASASFIVMHQLIKKKKKRKERRWWTTALVESRPRVQHVENIMSCMRSQEESGQFRNFCRMSIDDFDHLLSLIEERISRNNTNFRDAIPAKQRLALVLRYLATGDNYPSLTYLFQVSPASICNILREVCTAIINALRGYVETPSTEEEWLKVAQQFREKWDFPNCIGAIDGKHCVIQAPGRSGSDYFNYKSDFSIVLMAVVDANYKFIFADVGCQGRISDGGVFKNTSFHQKLQNGDLKLPPDMHLPGRASEIPYVFVADDAFPLQYHLMKPYPGNNHGKGSDKRIFNYRLSRARLVVENAFGILSSVFRVLRKPIPLEPEKASLVVMTCIYLHNFLMQRKSSRKQYAPTGLLDREINGERIDGNWRNDIPSNSLLPFPHVGRRNATQYEAIRKELMYYFCNCNCLPWQNDIA